MKWPAKLGRPKLDIIDSNCGRTHAQEQRDQLMVARDIMHAREKGAKKRWDMHISVNFREPVAKALPRHRTFGRRK